MNPPLRHASNAELLALQKQDTATNLTGRLEDLIVRMDGHKHGRQLGNADLVSLIESFLTLKEMANLVLLRPNHLPPDQVSDAAQAVEAAFLPLALSLAVSAAQTSLGGLGQIKAEALLGELQQLQQRIGKLDRSPLPPPGELQTLNETLLRLEDELDTLNRLRLQADLVPAATVTTLRAVFRAAEEGLSMSAAAHLLTFRRPA